MGSSVDQSQNQQNANPSGILLNHKPDTVTKRAILNNYERERQIREADKLAEKQQREIAEMGKIDLDQQQAIKDALATPESAKEKIHERYGIWIELDTEAGGVSNMAKNMSTIDWSDIVVAIWDYFPDQVKKNLDKYPYPALKEDVFKARKKGITLT